MDRNSVWCTVDHFEGIPWRNDTNYSLVHSGCHPIIHFPVVGLNSNGWFSLAMQKSPQFQLWSFLPFAPNQIGPINFCKYPILPKKMIKMFQIMTWFMTVLLLYHHCMLWHFVYIPQFSYFLLNALYEIKVRQRPKLPVEYPADPTTPYEEVSYEFKKRVPPVKKLITRSIMPETSPNSPHITLTHPKSRFDHFWDPP